jgi:hypothetical protein
MSILVLQPTRPSNPPALRDRADELIARMLRARVEDDLEIVQDDTAPPIPPHPSKYMRHATVRNYMLDTYLEPHHTHVLWIDSDLIDYPAELPTLLMEGVTRAQWTCPQCGMSTVLGDSVCGHQWDDTDAIAAPFAMLDRCQNRFYDIGGFIEKGNRARMWPPYFDQQGDIIELDSVGCCYLVPAALYRDGVRYAPPPTDYYVEHWSVMQAAKRRGYRIVALSGVQVTHAWLPDYGLELS